MGLKISNNGLNLINSPLTLRERCESFVLLFSSLLLGKEGDLYIFVVVTYYTRRPVHTGRSPVES